MPTLRRNKLLVLLAVALPILCGSACGKREQAKKISLAAPPQASLPPAEAADGRQLRIAVAAMTSPEETFNCYRDLLEYVGQKLGRKTRLVQRKTYAEVNELLRDRRVDVACVCTGGYVMGCREFGMELLIAPEVNGSAVYHSYVIVPAESEVNRFEELRGRTFAFTDPHSNTGKMYPTYLLIKMGETPGTFFKRYIFTRSHDHSIKAVASGLVDGAAVDSLIYEQMRESQPEVVGKTKLIAKSPPFGIPPLVIHREMPEELKRQLKEAFLAMSDDDDGRQKLARLKITRYIVPAPSAYDSVAAMEAAVRASAQGQF